MKSNLKLLLFSILTVLLCGCSTGNITIEHIGYSGRQQYNNELIMLDGISSDTTNLLGNYLLLDTMRNHPEQLIPALERLLDSDRVQEVRIALAETSLILAEHFRDDPDKAVKYHLSALIHAQNYIAEVILYHNFITPLYSIIANVTQVGVAAFIIVIFVPSLRKVRNVLSWR